MENAQDHHTEAPASGNTFTTTHTHAIPMALQRVKSLRHRLVGIEQRQQHRSAKGLNTDRLDMQKERASKRLSAISARHKRIVKAHDNDTLDKFFKAKMQRTLKRKTNPKIAARSTAFFASKKVKTVKGTRK